jgi:two-component system sensor histidine kinase KdpD
MLRERVDEDKDPDSLVLIDATERSTLRLQRLVENLLESLRIEAGNRSVRAQRVRLAEAVREAIDQISPLVKQKRQALNVTAPSSYPVIAADGPRLVQVLVNVLANAHKFAPPGSTITVGGEVTDAEVSVWVRDEGPGFPVGYDALQFAPFTRASPEEPDEPGVGLGLYIAHSIVTRHGGRLAVSDAQPGSLVSIVLPRETDVEDPGGR